MSLAAVERSSLGGAARHNLVESMLTIETICRGTQEMRRLMLTVQGCYWMSEIRMTAVELR